MSIPESVLKNLKHQFLVKRKEAIDELIDSLKSNPTNLSTVENFAFKLLNEDTWQSKQSAFLLSQKLMDYSDETFQHKILESAKTYFEFSEHRVREAVADCIGDLARVAGITVYQSVKDQLFGLIEDNFSRPETDASGPQSLAKIEASKREHSHDGHDHSDSHNDSVECKDNETQTQTQTETQTETIDTGNSVKMSGDSSATMKDKNDEKKDDTLNDNTRTSKASIKIIPKPMGQHDSEGWKCLWSAMKTIERMIVGLGTKFECEVDEQLLDLLKRSITHINRFVREVTYQTYSAICHSLSKQKLQKLGKELSIVIKSGLGDNWSQVRYASSYAVREFFDTFDNIDEQSIYFDTLLPAMCLNRYYVAAGVRVYSLETWKKLVGNEGKQLVAKYIDSVVEYFTKQAQADNHAVREAACHVIAELALKVSKVDETAVSQHVSILLDSLIACFKDESWPVRDAACIACGDFVSIFPTTVSEKDFNDLYHLWFEHLSDNIPSVREDAANALGKVIRAVGIDAEKRALEHIKTNLMKVTKQSSDSKKYSQLENTTLFGVAARRRRDNDAQLHSGQQQYSCGSLAPKLKRATRSGCMDHGFSRDRELWEYSDGSVHLLRELICVNIKYYDQFIAPLSQIAGIRHFAHFHLLQQTIWDSIPSIAKAVGKRKFKTYLELLLLPMIETLECKNRLAENSAGKCVMFINQFIGARMFQERLKPDQVAIIQKSQFVQLQI